MRPVSEKRLSAEHEQHQHAIRRGLLWWAKWENLPWLEKFLETLLRGCGLYQRGHRNLLDIGFCRQTLELERLPKAFDGFRILWISDLHADHIDGLMEKVLAMAAGVEREITILGGDFCFGHSMTDLAAQQAQQVAQTLLQQTPVYAVLGNHDFSPLADVLRGAGVTLLLNENTVIERSGQAIRIVGVDDCHYFKAHDLDLAMQGLNGQEFKILLSHSPELYADAAKKGIDLYLAGHTHGGQICLPNGRAVVYSAAAPRKCIRGLWHHDAMTGFTSGGAGASGVPVRFNCPGEINLFTLRKISQ